MPAGATPTNSRCGQKVCTKVSWAWRCWRRSWRGPSLRRCHFLKGRRERKSAELPFGVCSSRRKQLPLLSWFSERVWRKKSLTELDRKRRCRQLPRDQRLSPASTRSSTGWTIRRRLRSLEDCPRVRSPACPTWGSKDSGTPMAMRPERSPTPTSQISMHHTIPRSSMPQSGMQPRH
jgi:hypothetical protein